MKKRFNIIVFLLACTSLAQAQWSRIKGIEHSRFVDNIYNVNDTLITAAEKGIYYSIDEGDSWKFINSLPNENAWKIHCDGKNIITTGVETSIKIYFSSNLGKKWVKIPFTQDSVIYDIATYNNVIFVNCPSTSYTSHDFGKTWIKGNYFYDAGWNRIIVKAKNNLISQQQNGVVLSADWGKTWKIIGKNGGYLDAKDSTVVTLYSNKLFFTKNLGKSWDSLKLRKEFLSSGYDLHLHNNIVYAIRYDSIFRFDLAAKKEISPKIADTWVLYAMSSYKNNLFVHGIDMGLKKSKDLGNSWQSVTKGMETNPDEILYDPSTQKVYAYTYKFFYELNANNRHTWKRLHDNLPRKWSGTNTYIYNNNVIIPYYSQISVASINDFVWGNATVFDTWGSSGPSDYFVPWHDQLFMLNTNFSGDARIFTSINNGVTFHPYPPIKEGKVPDFIALAADNNKALYGVGGIGRNIYKLLPNESNWTKLSTNANFYFDVDEKNFQVDNGVFLIGRQLSSSSFDTCRISFNEGLTWKGVTIKDFPNIPYQSSLRIGNFYYRNNILYLGTSLGVYTSKDQAKTWQLLNDGFPKKRFCGSEFIIAGDYFYANCDGSVWKMPYRESSLGVVTGKVFFDENKNGIKDDNEIAARNSVLESTESGFIGNITSSGDYYFYTNQKTETIKVTPLGNYWELKENNKKVPVPSANVDFPLVLKDGVKSDLSVTACPAGVLRPGFETNYILTYENKLPITVKDARIELVFPSKLMTYIADSNNGKLDNDSTLIWQISEVKAFETTTISIRFKVKTTTPLGTDICVTSKIFPSIDDDQRNNRKTCCEKVIGSYDPNDKNVTPRNNITPKQIADREELIYKIRFQNTGTYLAEFVKILDTLSTAFDWSSFRFIASSHPCQYTFKGRGELEFIFDNINLPDSSSNQAASHGFVQYAIRPKAQTSLGATLSNRAFIYFDYNTPIETNTTKTLVKQSVKTFDILENTSLTIFPNPASEQAIIKTDFEAQIFIYDLQGKLIESQYTQNQQLTLSLKNYGKQIYLIQAIGNGKTAVGKLLVE